MKLLADENIPDELVDILRERGHDILEIPPRTKDPEVALFAKKEHRILITQDKDLANIIWYPPKNYHGIIRLKFHPKELDKKLVILEKAGFRIR